MEEQIQNAQQAVESQSTKPAEPAGEASAELNINDLMAIKSIIDVASQRGSFRASELEAVGKTYNKLSKFLDTVTKKEG